MPAHDSQSIRNALIRRSIDLQQLYRHAAAACEPGLRVVLGENAHLLGLLIEELQASPSAAGCMTQQRGSLSAPARCRLTGWLMRASARPDNAWIRALVHHESALLLAFEHAVENATPADQPGLRRQLLRLRGMHLDMHQLLGDAHC